MPISIALIIEFTAPIWIVLYIRFIRKLHVPSMMWLSLGLGFSGLLLVGQVWRGLTLNGIGLIAAFVDAFALAAYFLLGEKLVAQRSTGTLTVWGLGFASLVWAVFTPTVCLLIWLPRKQGGEVHLLEACLVHLFTNDGDDLIHG